METENLFKTLLRDRNERLSSPRLQLFRLIVRKSPLSSQELVELGQQQAIDPATTYRTIKLYRELGIIRDLVIGGRRMLELTDVYGVHHHHFWCSNCGQLQDFDSELIEASLEAVAMDMGVTITGHQLEISGICADCRLLD
jgi:Fe2+ or Zn2+ uptake regulation protein